MRSDALRRGGLGQALEPGQQHAFRRSEPLAKTYSNLLTREQEA